MFETNFLKAIFNYLLLVIKIKLLRKYFYYTENDSTRLKIQIWNLRFDSYEEIVYYLMNI